MYISKSEAGFQGKINALSFLWGSGKFGLFHKASSFATSARWVPYAVTILSGRTVNEGSFYSLKVTENIRKASGDSVPESTMIQSYLGYGVER